MVWAKREFHDRSYIVQYEQMAAQNKALPAEAFMMIADGTSEKLNIYIYVPDTNLLRTYLQFLPIEAAELPASAILVYGDQNDFQMWFAPISCKGKEQENESTGELRCRLQTLHFPCVCNLLKYEPSGPLLRS